jgi:NTE family protein
MGPDELVIKADEYVNSPEFQSSAIKGFEAANARGEPGLTQKIQSYLRNRYYVVQAMFKPGILSNDEFQETINYFIPDVNIEDMRVPFRAVATDLVSGEHIIFSEGSLRQAVMASCAVPGAIEPLKEGEWLLSDGGIINNIPVSVAREEGADVVIAVVVDRGISSEELRNVVDIYHRVSEIMGEKLKGYELANADVVILPDVGESHWSDFSQGMDMIEEGEKAARDKLDDVRKAIPGIKKWFGVMNIKKNKLKRDRA